MTNEAAIQTFENLTDVKVFVCKEHGYELRNLKRHLLEHLINMFCSFVLFDSIRLFTVTV